MPWTKHRLRDASVWARVDASGQLVTDSDGRVDVVYQAKDGAKVYRAAARNLAPEGGAPIDLAVGEAAAPAATKSKAAPAGKAPSAGVPAHAIHVWTDGACTGNPGPAGIGVVIVDGTDVREVSEFLGDGTNNIAELTAIERGLQLVTARDRPVAVYSDSSYAIGLLSQGWKAKANVELVARLRTLCRTFADLRFVKVAGHSGIPLNERTDELATSAVRRRG